MEENWKCKHVKCFGTPQTFSNISEVNDHEKCCPCHSSSKNCVACLFWSTKGQEFIGNPKIISKEIRNEFETSYLFFRSTFLPVEDKENSRKSNPKTARGSIRTTTQIKRSTTEKEQDQKKRKSHTDSQRNIEQISEIESKTEVKKENTEEKKRSWPLAEAASFFKPEDNDVWKTGWIKKRGPPKAGASFTWKQRYCVVHKLFLYYYENEKVKKYKGIISLERYTCVEEDDSESFSFVIKAPKDPKAREYLFSTNSKEEQNEWIEAIREAIKSNQ